MREERGERRDNATEGYRIDRSMRKRKVRRNKFPVVAENSREREFSSAARLRVASYAREHESGGELRDDLELSPSAFSN